MSTYRNAPDRWLSEKAINVLSDVARIVQITKDQRLLSVEDVLDIRDYLSGALYNLAKIVTFSAGADDGPHPGEIQASIMKDPVEGVEEFLYRLGLIHETPRMRVAREVCEVLHPIAALLDGPPGENRTQIHELLAAYRGTSEIVKTISELIEDVTNGLMPWDEYGARCRAIIATHECGITNEASDIT
jgi:hypothetical protein